MSLPLRKCLPAPNRVHASRLALVRNAGQTGLAEGGRGAHRASPALPDRHHRAQDYRDVGNRAVGVLEALSRTIYDPSVHLRDGDTEPPADKTEQRLGRYVEDFLAGRDNAALRSVAYKVIEPAHSVKHSTAPTRRRGRDRCGLSDHAGDHLAAGGSRLLNG